MSIILFASGFLLLVCVVLSVLRKKLVVDGWARIFVIIGLSFQFFGLLISNLILKLADGSSDGSEAVVHLELDYDLVFSISFYMAPIGLIFLCLGIILACAKDNK